MNGSCVVATRGEELPYRAPVVIDSSYLAAGRRFVAFTGSDEAEQGTAAAHESKVAWNAAIRAKKALCAHRAQTVELKAKLADARNSAAKWRKEYKKISATRTWRALSRLNRVLKAARNSILGGRLSSPEDNL
jgi:hypothetical protein